MTQPVTSNLTKIYWFKAAVFSLFVFTSMIACIHYSVNYNPAALLSTGIFSLVLVIVYIYLAIRLTRKITAAPDGLIIEYLLTKRQIIINYDDITHVENIRVNGNRENALFPSFRSLAIEISTGENLSINESDFNNYDDLKEAIRRNRFHLE